MKRTKIIATIGPATSSKDMMRQLMLAGVNVFRLNFSHGSHHDHLQTIQNTQALNQELDTHVALLADLSGPKIRTGIIKNNSMPLEQDQEIVLTTQQMESRQGTISVNYPDFAKDVRAGERILIDDGKIQLQALHSNGTDKVTAVVKQAGILHSHKGVNLPNTALSLPSLTEKDYKDLDFITQQPFNWVALSFVRQAEDISQLRHKLEALQPNNQIFIMAKIEKPEAIKNIRSIIAQSDGIMVARGDLAVEIPQEQMPVSQKIINNECIAANKPIVIATQMMEGMINNMRPTRAELNDVANAVLDGADALMLSAETSVGHFPLETIQTMQSIIDNTEKYSYLWHTSLASNTPKQQGRILSDAVITAATNLSEKIDAKALIAHTNTGYTAFHLSGQRAKAPIYIFSYNRQLLAGLNLLWGVKPLFLKEYGTTADILDTMRARLKAKGLIKEKDYVIHVFSTPITDLGKTNTLKLARV